MYTVDKLDDVVESLDAPPPSPGAPMPVLIGDDVFVQLAYIVSEPDPEWDGTTVRIVSPDTEDMLVAIITFPGPYAHMFGPPNDEAFAGHPLAGRGLRPHAVFEVRQSSWVRSLERMNSVHPSHMPKSFSSMRHFVFAFHDSTFECVARGFGVRLFAVQSSPLPAAWLKRARMSVPMRATAIEMPGSRQFRPLLRPANAVRSMVSGQQVLLPQQPETVGWEDHKLPAGPLQRLVRKRSAMITTSEPKATGGVVGQAVDVLDSPQLLIDLDVVDANLERMFAPFRGKGVGVRVHFKSLKCGGLAQHIAKRGANGFLCAKLNEAEVLADAGLNDILVANQIVGDKKIRRLAQLARRADVKVCVDDADNVHQLSQAAAAAGATLGVLVEVDIGMNRCGVDPGEPALALARKIHASPGLRFDGLQGYDGHLQLLDNREEKRARCLQALEKLVGTRRLIEKSGIPVSVVTGAGTGTWEFVGHYDGVTEIQPGSFVLMDVAYHAVRPEFGCSLSVWTTVISRRPGRYILDAGSKAISRDFGTPSIKGRPADRVLQLSEEHAKVESDDAGVKIGDHREVIPAHCCATMNLHRNCVAVRKGKIEALWPIEASGRYD